MKRTIFALLAGCAAFASCTEKAPRVNLLPAQTKFDTTYLLTTVPAAEPHNVLIENFTGATCTNCPLAHDVIHTIDSQYAGRINLINLHLADYPLASPVAGAAYDFRSTDATNIAVAIFKLPSTIPIAGIDRLPSGSSSDPLSSFRSAWPSAVSTRLTAVDSINLDIHSTYDAATRKATITAKVTYLQPVSFLQNLSIVIVEDSFIDKQEYFNGVGTGTYQAYHFDDIFRGMVTDVPFGDPILPTMPVKVAGRVYEVTYIYNVSTGFNANNCRLIAFVSGSTSNGGATIYQSKQTKLVP